MADVQLDYVVPEADLAPYVTVFYRFVADLEVIDELERADTAQFRFHVTGSAGRYRYADGVTVAAPPCHLMAASHRVRRAQATGPILIFGMGLTPAGWAALVEDGRHRERVLDAEALLGDAVRQVVVALAAAADTAAMVRAVEPLIRPRFAAVRPATLAFVGAVDAWLGATASPGLDRLVAATALSRRQVERRCNALYGAPPKLLARKYRALRAAVGLASGAETVDSLIADGFYDQSHLIREVKQFTGLTPRQIRQDPGLLAGMTIARRSALRGQVGLLVSDT